MTSATVTPTRALTSTSVVVTSSTVPSSAKGTGPVPSGFDPVSFTAISDNEFWLLGDAPCPNPVCTSIVRTTNGGSSFVGVPAPAAALAFNSGAVGATGVNTLRFADANDGYAFAYGDGADNFWDTHDGGKAWSQPGALQGKDLLAFGTGNGYAFVLVETCQSQGASCSSPSLLRSPSGSDTWATLSLPPATSGASTAEATLAVQGPDLWLSLTTPSSQSNQLLVASTDSGSTFTTHTSPCLAALGANLQATSSAVLWAVCPTGMMAEAFRSSDGGASWSQLDNKLQLPNSALLAPVSATTAFLSDGDQSPLLETTDGGSSWHNAPGTTPTGTWGWQWAGFTDSQTGSALQSEGTAPAGWPWPDGPPPEQLLRTTDGGATWSGPVKIS